MKQILQEFEHILRLREFISTGDKLRQKQAYNEVKESLGNEYVDNIDEKILRWISATKAEYFLDKKSVETYFEAKMLYRDGFFRGCISVCRTICEMVCYEILTAIDHPFGDLNAIEQESYSPLLKFIAFPKTISKTDFNEKILKLIPDGDEKNFFKSSFTLQKDKYILKNENGKTSKNLNRLFAVLKLADHKAIDNFSSDSFQFLNDIYDLGSDYIHGRKTTDQEKDALLSIDRVGFVLFELYGVNGINEFIGSVVISAYSRFPQIHTGINFMTEFFSTPEAALKASRYDSKEPNDK